MFSRVLTFRGAKNVDGGVGVVRDTLPVLRGLKGYRGVTASADRDGGVFGILSLWETEADRDASLDAAVDDRQVSRHHAQITCEGDEFWIEDLNSTNGTRVNGVRIERQKLANNDQIGLGDAIVTFTMSSA